MVKSSGKSRSKSRVSKRKVAKRRVSKHRVSKRSHSTKGGKRSGRKSVRKSGRKSIRKAARKSGRKTLRKSIKGGKRRRTVRKTLRKRMRGGRVALPTEYFGGNSRRYSASPSTSYKTHHGASVGRSHGSGKVPGFHGTGPNLSPGMGGGRRVRRNKNTHRRTKKSKIRFAKK
jgi:hypothetical protein